MNHLAGLIIAEKVLKWGGVAALAVGGRVAYKAYMRDLYEWDVFHRDFVNNRYN